MDLEARSYPQTRARAGPSSTFQRALGIRTLWLRSSVSRRDGGDGGSPSVNPGASATLESNIIFDKETCRAEIPTRPGKPMVSLVSD